MKKSARLFSLLPITLAVSTAVAAQSGYTTLETSVVSAAGYAQDTREAPASVSVITSHELQTKPVSDIGQAVGDVPGVDISETKMGNSTVSIRGFDSKYTLVLIDGRKQNTSEGMISNGFDPGSTFMPAKGAIERIELIRGPASTVYGSDAVGGVINIITKKHVDKFTGSIGVETTQFFEPEDWGNRYATNVYLGIPLVSDTLSLQLRARYLAREKSELKTPTGSYATHSPSEGFTGNAGARLTYSPDTSNTYYLDGDYTRMKGGAMNTSSSSYKALRWWNKYNAVIGHTGTYDFGTTESYLQYNALDQVKSWHGASSNGKVAPETTRGNPLINSTTYTLSTRVNSPLSFGSYGSMMLAYGLLGEYETFEDNTVPAQTALYGKTLEQTTLQAFAEGEYFINDAWIATLGARAHWSDIFGGHLAPRAYLVYKPLEALSFKGGVAAGYKTPAVKQLTDGVYAYSSSRNGTYNTWGDPDLKPEESLSYELSATLDMGSVASLTLGAFLTDFENQIDVVDKNDGTLDQIVINHGKVRSKGFEVLLQTVPVHGFRFSGGYTFTDAKIKSGDLIVTAHGLSDRPNSLPRHTLTARLDYEKDNFSAYIKSVSKFDSEVQTTKNAPTRSKYKDYTKVDIGATYVYEHRHQFSVALNNIFDVGVQWVEASSGYANAYKEYIDGRNLWLSYSYSF